MNAELQTKVGIGVMVFRDGKVLLGKRKNSHGSGEFAFPGGHLEYMEGFEECAKREVFEETGLRIGNIRFQLLSNVKHYAPKHYVHIGLIADWVEGKAEVKEVEKCESWDWYDLQSLPSPLFEVCRISLEAKERNINYLDANDEKNSK